MHIKFRKKRKKAGLHKYIRLPLGLKDTQTRVGQVKMVSDNLYRSPWKAGGSWASVSLSNVVKLCLRKEIQTRFAWVVTSGKLTGMVFNVCD